MKLEKLFQLGKAISLLRRPNGASVYDLMEALSLEMRSTRRLVAELIKMGCDVDKIQDGHQIRYQLLDLVDFSGMSVPKVDLSPSELLSLCHAASRVRPLPGSNDIGHLIGKLAMTLADELQPKFRCYQKSFVAGVKHGKKAPEDLAKNIQVLADAIFRQRVCKVSYFSFHANKEGEFDIDPLCFFQHNGGLYIFFFSHKDRKIRQLAVERIRRIEQTSNTFTPPASFDPQKALDSRFGIEDGVPETVQVQFDKDAARYVKERLWTVDQKFEDSQDGTVTLTMNVPVTWELTSWILSFGDACTVLGPKKLAGEVGSIAMNICEAGAKKENATKRDGSILYRRRLTVNTAR